MQVFLRGWGWLSDLARFTYSEQLRPGLVAAVCATPMNMINDVIGRAGLSSIY